MASQRLSEQHAEHFEAFSQQWLSRLEADTEGKIIEAARPRKLRTLAYLLKLNASDFYRRVGVPISAVPLLDKPSRAAKSLSNQPYSPGLHIPILGTVAAGMPLEVNFANDDGSILIDESMLPPGVDKSKLYTLRVAGDSMVAQDISGGIPSGSAVVVEAGQVGRAGDIVVAYVECPGYEGGVVKQVRDDSGRTVLASFNPDGPAFRASQCEKIIIQGIVRLILTPPSAITRHIH